MSGSFSLLVEFLTHPVFVGSACIFLAGGLLSALFGIIFDRSCSDLTEAIGGIGFFLSVLGSFASFVGFLVWSL